MSHDVVKAQDGSEVAEQALRALWMFDVVAFESCRCACCGGLRQIDREGFATPARIREPAAGSSPA